jgi:hypothetical protein
MSSRLLDTKQLKRATLSRCGVRWVRAGPIVLNAGLFVVGFAASPRFDRRKRSP